MLAASGQRDNVIDGRGALVVRAPLRFEQAHAAQLTPPLVTVKDRHGIDAFGAVSPQPLADVGAGPIVGAALKTLRVVNSVGESTCATFLAKTGRVPRSISPLERDPTLLAGE